jgi:hypothetical protein
MSLSDRIAAAQRSRSGQETAPERPVAPSSQAVADP